MRGIATLRQLQPWSQVQGASLVIFQERLQFGPGCTEFSFRLAEQLLGRGVQGHHSPRGSKGQYRIAHVAHDGRSPGGGLLQAVHDLVVQPRDLAHLGKGLFVHPQCQISRLHLFFHVLQQVDQFGGGAVFRDIQALVFVFHRDTQWPDAIGNPKNEVGHTKTPCATHDGASRLYPELIHATEPRADQTQIAKQGHGQRTPDAGPQVRRDGTHGIIDAQLQQHFLEQQHDRPGNGTDDHGAWGIHHMTIGRDGHKPGDGAIDQGFWRNQTGTQSIDDDGHQATTASRHQGIGDHHRHPLVELQGAAAVEPDPTEKEHEHAHGGKWHVTAGNGHRTPLGIEAPGALPQYQHPRQRHPAATAVHHGRTGKIDEAHRAQEAGMRGIQPLTPDPMAVDGVDQSGHHEGGEAIADKVHTLGHSTRDDGSRGSAEHELEDIEHGLVRQMVAAEWHRHVAQAHQTLPIAPEHETKGKQIEHHRGDHEIEGVLHGHVDGVLGAGEACFQAQKAHLHGEDQGRGDQHPQDIHGVHVKRSKRRYQRRMPRPGSSRNRHNTAISGCSVAMSPSMPLTSSSRLPERYKRR